ncbi:UNVERIFIED_CONTAM: hypothetical protein Slati_4255600 [Sesamum latifolium]|uniref:Uncharacterized protein n=1 Tax=Sesamum latifolium TaxID=2727402 RepID=A0AAW2TC83_9LAMI
MGCSRGTLWGDIRGVRKDTSRRSARKSGRSVWCRAILRKSIGTAYTTILRVCVDEDVNGSSGEDVTGRSLGKTAGCDLRRTCGRLGDAGRHAGVGTALEQRLLMIGDCKTVPLGTSLVCGDAIRQI